MIFHSNRNDPDSSFLKSSPWWLAPPGAPPGGDMFMQEYAYPPPGGEIFMHEYLFLHIRRILICKLTQWKPQIAVTVHLFIRSTSSFHSMCLATHYANFKTFKGLRVTMDDTSGLASASSARGAWDCGLKCRRMKGCLGYNFNRGSKKCELLKVQSWSAKWTQERVGLVRRAGEGMVVGSWHGCHNLFGNPAALAHSLKINRRQCWGDKWQE